MMRNLLIPIIAILCALSSCSKHDAVYEQSADFNKLSEGQVLNALFSKTNNLENTGKNVARSDFNWNQFYQLLNERLDLETADLSDFKKVMLDKNLECSASSKTNIISILSKFKTQYPSASIFNQVFNIQNKCEGAVHPSIARLVQKEIHNEFYRDLDNGQNNLREEIERVMFIDRGFNQYHVSSASNTYSLSSQELAGVGVRLVRNGNLDQAIGYMRMHRSLYPASSSFRQIILNAVINDQEKFKKVIANNTIEEISRFIRGFALQDETIISNTQFNIIFGALYDEFKKKYDVVDPYRLYQDTFRKFTADYLEYYKLLKRIKVNDSSLIIKNFNHFNLLANRIYSRDLDLAIKTLDENHGGNKALVYFHEVVLKQKLMMERVNNEFSSTIADETALDQILQLRINILTGDDQSQLNEFCDLLESDFNSPRKTINKNQIKSHLKLGIVGCYQVNQSISISNDQYHQYKINQNQIETYFDLAFIVNDTDITITTNQYQGPIWSLSTKRSHEPFVFNPPFEQDAKLIPLVYEIKFNESFMSGYTAGTYQLIYNYQVEEAKEAPKLANVNIEFETPFRGGNLLFKYQDTESYLPILFSNGSLGQKGPEPVSAGEGIDQTEIDTAFFESAPESVWDYLFFGGGKTIYRNIFKADPEITINWDISRAIWTKLCGGSFQHMDACQVNGKEYRQITLTQSEGDIIADLRNKLENLLYVSNQYKYDLNFKFPPNLKDKNGETVFSDGEAGANGELTLERQ